MTHIATYIGTSTDSTDQIFLKQPWDKCLGQYECTPYGSSMLSENVASSFGIERTTERGGNKKAITKTIASYRDTIEYLSSNSPDLVLQLMRYPTHGPGVSFAARKQGVPCITRCTVDPFQGFHHHDFPHNLLVWGLSNVIGRIPTITSDKMIALGPNMKQKFIDKGMDTDDVHIIPPVIDLKEKFHPVQDKTSLKNQFGLSTHKKVILYVGRLSRMKGMDFLIDVIKSVSSSLSSTFVLVGDGPYRDIFENNFDNSLVRTVGEVPYEDIDKYYKMADVYIHPSPHEGIPLSLQEALECGTPVIARNAGDVELLTSSTVSTTKEMANAIINSDYRVERNNSEMFTTDYMIDKFDELVTGTLTNTA